MRVGEAPCQAKPFEDQEDQVAEVSQEALSPLGRHHHEPEPAHDVADLGLLFPCMPDAHGGH